MSMFDIKRYFDSESAHDCWSELYKSQVKGKAYRLLFNLNKNTRIRVKTPVGVSQAAETGPLVSQGSVEGAVISAVNLDRGIREYFHEEQDEDDKDVTEVGIEKENVVEEANKDGEVMEDVMYSSIQLKPLLFQDDVFNASKSPEAAQIANEKMVKLMESKLLDLHQDKSCYIIAGEKKARLKLKKNLISKPLLLYNNKMREVGNNKYLGCLLSSTVSQSVTDTVNSRIGLARRAVYEIRTIIEDSRASVVGSIQVGLNIWEMSVIPMLLSSSEVWSDIPSKTMRKLEETHSLMLTNLLGVSKRGCPEVSLYLETGSLTMKNQIILHQMLFLRI